MAPLVCRGADRRPAASGARWSTHVSTTAHPGRAALVARGRAGARLARARRHRERVRQPFDTWASMSQLLDVESWPEDDRPRHDRVLLRRARRTVASDGRGRRYPRRQRARVRAPPVRRADTPPPLPGALDDGGFRWDLLCGARRAPARARSTPSSAWPTSIRPTATSGALPAPTLPAAADESGYDNLVLAGDWTDSGSTPGASRRRSCPASRPPTRCSAARGRTGSPASTCSDSTSPRQVDSRRYVSPSLLTAHIGRRQQRERRLSCARPVRLDLPPGSAPSRRASRSVPTSATSCRTAPPSL